MNELFVFGLGYTATFLGKHLLEEGWRVGGTVRSSGKVQTLSAEGLSALFFSNSEGVAKALSTATHLLISTPPCDEGDPALLTYAAALDGARALRWLGYLSTIGVYGDHQGAWVDENTIPAPATERGAARIQAEQAWSGFAKDRGLPLDIFRLSGIYGPGRNKLERIDEGDARRIVKPGQVFNRIHVDDICLAIEAAISQERQGEGERIFNVTDDEPAPPQDVIAYAAGIMGVPPPPQVPFENASLSPMARSFYSDNKRVSNSRMKRDLGLTLRYPTYREGLKALASSKR